MIHSSVSGHKDAHSPERVELEFHYTPYVIPLALAALVTGALAVYSWRRRSLPGAGWFAVLMAAMTWWLAFYVLFASTRDLETKTLWSMIGSPGPALVPLAWLAFSLEYSGFGKWLTRRNIILLAAIPLATVVLAATNNLHGLLWAHTTLSADGALHVQHGPWFWVWTVYCYLLMAVGTLVLLRVYLGVARLYRRQAGMLLAGALVAWVANILHVAGVAPGPNLDLTPFGLTLFGLAAAWALFNYRLLDIAPLARDAAIESMSDGMIALDGDSRVVDLNPAAQAMLACDRSRAIGRPAAELLPGWTEIVDDARDEPSAPTELALGDGADLRNFDLRVSPLSDTRGRPTGRLLILREITRQKKAELKLQEEKRKIETLHDIARLMGASESEADVLELTVYAAEMVLGLTYCHIALLEEGDLVGKASCAALTPEMTETIPLRVGPASMALSKGKTYVIPDFSEDPDLASAARHFRSGVFSPLDGLGVALALSPQPASYTQDDARLMELLLGHTVEALKRIRLQESFRQQVVHDPLTGVYNRRHFTATLAKELERAKRYGHPIGFLMLDINDFKDINDRFGHQVGDQVLQGVAGLLMEQVREMDVVVRYGGDEFLVVLPETDGETDSVAHRIRQALTRWNQEGRLLQGFSVSLAIGTSHWDPAGTETLETILHDADQRMYQDKESRNRGASETPFPDLPASG